MINLSSVNGYSILSYKQLPFKVNNRNTRTWCEISLKLTIKTPWSNVSIIEQVIISVVISLTKIMLYVRWTADYRSYLLSLKIETEQRSSRVRRVLLHFVDSWWFCPTLFGSRQILIILWFTLFIGFIFLTISVPFQGI